MHHAPTAGLRTCGPTTPALSSAVLGAVSLVPFSADILGTERVAEPWSTVVLADDVGLVPLAVGLLARHVAREPHLAEPDRSVAALGR